MTNLLLAPEVRIGKSGTGFRYPLSALTNDEVFLALIDALSPGVLKINGPFLYVVIPMRLSWAAARAGSGPRTQPLCPTYAPTST